MLSGAYEPPVGILRTAAHSTFIDTKEIVREGIITSNYDTDCPSVAEEKP